MVHVRSAIAATYERRHRVQQWVITYRLFPRGSSVHDPPQNPAIPAQIQFHRRRPAVHAFSLGPALLLLGLEEACTWRAKASAQRVGPMAERRQWVLWVAVVGGGDTIAWLGLPRARWA